MVLNLKPVLEVCCRLQGPMKEYRLFVIGSVTTECTQQQMRNRKKCFGGWNVMWTVGFNHWTPQGCYRLPSMLLKARGSLRQGFAVIRPYSVSDHNFQRPHERKGICESKSKQSTVRKRCSVKLLKTSRPCSLAQIWGGWILKGVISWTGQQVVLVSVCKMK